jgi:hypothetical protein
VKAIEMLIAYCLQGLEKIQPAQCKVCGFATGSPLEDQRLLVKNLALAQAYLFAEDGPSILLASCRCPASNLRPAIVAREMRIANAIDARGCG